jgi:formamidopyrimidine-DNA glycosylase
VPELPEVEVVRRGLARWVTGTTITSAEVLHPRPVRRHEAGIHDFISRLVGTQVLDAVRRGKFLWFVLDSGEALLAHLGMSGQLVLQPPDAPAEKHLRVRIGLSGDRRRFGGRELRFIDQRMFGGLHITDLVATPDGGPGGWGGVQDPGGLVVATAAAAPLLPVPVAHIARDVLDPELDVAEFRAKLRRRRTGLKRALLDQTLISGIGNIYADEALWIAKLHYARATENVTAPEINRLLAAVQQVMREALAQGGTSFDSLYVDVNGSSGYFERSLKAYGRAGLPCYRCGTLVKRAQFMNRGSFLCPLCQRPPRNARW